MPISTLDNICAKWFVINGTYTNLAHSSKIFNFNFLNLYFFLSLSPWVSNNIFKITILYHEYYNNSSRNANDTKIASTSPSANFPQVKLMPSRRRRLPTEPIVSATLKDPRNIPASLDWREYGFVTPPVNQRSCGSCYAYSIAESIEGQIFKQTGMLLPVSAQQLVDCSTATGNLGCTGGSLRNTLKYLEKSKGLMARSTYPYNGEVRTTLSQLSRVRRIRYSVGAPIYKIQLSNRFRICKAL